MSDVKLEREETLSREEAAAWLAQLSKAFSGEEKAELPFGSGTVSLRIPGSVRAELEVEVEDDEVEIEIEFSWTKGHHEATPSMEEAAARRPRSRPENGTKTANRQHDGAPRPAKGTRSKYR
jgi:amphi-Trp domain-containing protein